MSITEDHAPFDVTQGQGESQVYELAYLILPSIPEENLPQVVANIQEVIEKEGGKKIDSENPFLRELTYEMSKVVGASRYVVKNAYIGWIKFDLPTQKEDEKHPIETIKEKVEKTAEVLRFLLVKVSRETKFTFASTRAAKIELEERPAGGDIIEEPVLNEEIPEVIVDPESVIQ
ncbi:MAG: 30S ribosomal protein S6 [Patescibacteria group bacterium]